MKKRIALLLSLLLVLSLLGACTLQTNDPPASENPDSTNTDDPANTDDHQFTIGLAFGAMDATPTVIAAEMTERAEARGWKVILTNADQDTSKLLGDVEALCEMSPDVIICRPINELISQAVMEACYEAGVPIIFLGNWDRTMEDKYLTGPTEDITASGELMAQYLNNWLDEDPTRVANVGYIIGDYALSNTVPRWTSVRDNVPRANSLVDAEANPKWTAQGAMSITEDWLQKYDDMNVIVCSSDEMSIGVIQALQAAGKDPDDFLILSYDGLEIVYDYIREGWIAASAALDLEMQCDIWIDICELIRQGRTDEIPKLTPMDTTFTLSTQNIEGILDGTIAKEYYIPKDR